MKTAKQNLLFLALIGISFHVQAQFVTIPDNNFRNILKSRFSGCFNSNNEMDTTCPGIITTKRLVIKSSSIKSIDGIQFFDELDTLECKDNELTTLPTLPRKLTLLSCSRNKLTSLPKLPSQLKNLSIPFNELSLLPSLPSGLIAMSCGDNMISDLPPLPSSLQYLDFSNTNIRTWPFLPSTLTELNCSGNKLKVLGTLPSSLKRLDCTDDSLIQFPQLPSTLTLLNCSSNQITTLPTLPSTLTDLYCSENNLSLLPALPPNLNLISASLNQLSTLPSLPSSLSYLNCTNNSLTILPTLPAKLTQLLCSKNLLKGLPTLPLQLRELDCSDNLLTALPSIAFITNLQSIMCHNNKLTALPNLPSSLSTLSCFSNQLKCLPFLPQQLYSLGFDMNLIKCLPNIPNGIAANYSGYPICNSTIGCQFYPAIKGKFFLDANLDGIFNPQEKLVPYGILRSDKVNEFAISSLKGEYFLNLQALGNYVFTPDTIKNFTIVPAFKSVTFTESETIDQNFALQVKNNIADPDIKLSGRNFARPGLQTSFEITLTNFGTLPCSNSATFSYPTNFLTDSITGGGNDNGNGLITWNKNLDPLENSKFRIYGHISSVTPLNAILPFYAFTTCGSGNQDPKTADSLLVSIRSSFDPNDKTAIPYITPEKVAKGEYIDYTIRFQNTGNDTAFTIILKDTLPLSLQAKSLEVINSSHNCQAAVTGSVVSFEFQNINLLWKSVNEPLSNGFIRFRIKPVTTLTIGNKISNNAAIHFDFNKAVITNSAVTTVGYPPFPLRIEGKESNFLFKLHPNPTSSEIILSGNGLVEIFTLMGELVWKAYITDKTADISSLPSGVYYLKLNRESGVTQSAKLIKQ